MGGGASASRRVDDYQVPQEFVVRAPRSCRTYGHAVSHSSILQRSIYGGKLSMPVAVLITRDDHIAVLDASHAVRVRSPVRCARRPRQCRRTDVVFDTTV